ncbi:endo-1,4-beta-xylanase [Paenibacillus sp. CMAA1364]
MRKVFTSCLAFLLIIGLLMPIGRLENTIQAASTIVLDNGFEDGQIGGWKAFNCNTGAQTVVSSVYAANGSQSLLLSQRESKDCSPSIDLSAIITGGHSYEVSLKVRLGTGSDNAHIVMKSTQDGNDMYDWVVGDTTINDTGWVTLSNPNFTLPTNATNMTMYIETNTSIADVFIDDVLIVNTSSDDNSGGSGTPPTGPTEFGYNFDDGTTQGWVHRDDTQSVVVEASKEQFRSGPNSLKTTGRTKDWHGPTMNVFDKITKNAKYEISAFVKLVDTSTTSHPFKISAELDASGSKSWLTIASGAVTGTDWVELKGTFTYNANLTDLNFYIESSVVNASFYLDDVFVKMTGIPSETPPVQLDLAKLKDVYQNYFQIGAALEPNRLEGKSKQLLDMHFNSIVAENSMKPSSISSLEDRHDFANADKLADYARQNGLNMRFHTLVWHEQVADWMFKTEDGTQNLTPSPANKELVLHRLKDYLEVVVPRYADIASSWDVVNEVIDAKNPDGMRSNSLWYQLTGEDFIKVAFTETRRILDELYANDPTKYAVAGTAKLYINDYSTDNPSKAQALFNLLTRLEAAGVQVDGVGHQTHININGPSVQQISDSIKMFGEAGYDNQLTELDVSVYTNNTDASQVVPEELLVKQGYRYKELFEELKKLDDMGRTVNNPEGWISNVTFWGISDDHTWLHNRPVTRQDAPFAFDMNFQAKPAYWGMVDPSKLVFLKKTAYAANGSPDLSTVDDFVWHTVAGIPLDKSGTLEATMKTLWDPNNLYVKAVVIDNSNLPGDTVELFIKDGDNITTVKIARGSANSVETNNGYTIVAQVPLSGSTTGRIVSFDIRVTDSGSDNGSEHGKNGNIISWSDLGNNQQANTTGYGDLTFMPAVKTSKAIHGTPIIGHGDAIWAIANEISTDIWVTGTSGATAKVKTMWDSGHLYVYAHVTDSLLSKKSTNAHEQDSLEIFINPSNSKSSSYGAADGQYRVNYLNEQSYNGVASADNFHTRTQLVDGGYIVEATIDLDPKYTVADSVIGFDIQVNNDETGDGTRSSVAIWNDPTGSSYENTSRFGALELVGKPGSGGIDNGDKDPVVTPPSTPSTPVNGDGNVITGGTVKVSIHASDFKNALSESKAGLLKFQLKGTVGSKQVSVTIPVNQIQAAKLAGITTIEIAAGIATVQLPVSLFEGADSTASVELNISKVDLDTLSEMARETIGSNTVYNLDLSVGGQKISKFGKGQSVRVSLPYTLKSSENPNKVVIYYLTDNGKLEIIKNGRYNTSTGMVEFNATHFSQYAATSVDVNFNDVASIIWANDSILGLAARGIVNGVSPQVFSPNVSVTRAEFIHMLIQTLDLNQTNASSTFNDVKKDSWYYNAVASAQKLDITSGLSNNSFGINDPISRQDMIVMVYRALQLSDIPLDLATTVVDFKDQAFIATYAKEAISALQHNNIINGMDDGNFAPLEIASRAQAAVLLYH